MSKKSSGERDRRLILCTTTTSIFPPFNTVHQFLQRGPFHHPARQAVAVVLMRLINSRSPEQDSSGGFLLRVARAQGGLRP
jgi:hypothetical protein